MFSQLTYLRILKMLFLVFKKCIFKCISQYRRVGYFIFVCFSKVKVIISGVAAQGWPALQIHLLQQLVVAARRMGHSALATRHMTFLLQTMWHHLNPTEQRDLAKQLQKLAAECEGAPVPLVLDSRAVIPPANLTNIPLAK